MEKIKKPKNTELVKQIANTPYTLIEKENGKIIIVIGKQAISEQYNSFEEAEEELKQAGLTDPLVLATIAVIAETIYNINTTLKN
jgi:hypothetical protein